ncbi:hypothetical protein CL656_00815 [bacterium]|nr:hypothetical protein [bacterium]
MPIISKFLKLSIISIFILFVTLSYTKTAESQMNTLDKIQFTAKSIYNGLVNFSSYYEDFINTNFDVYKGARYINNFCNTRDRFFVVEQRQDLYNLLVKNGFGYTRGQIAIINEQIKVLELELIFLRNVDVYQTLGYGDKLIGGSETVNQFKKVGLPLMFDRLSKTYEKIYNEDSDLKQNKERIYELINIFTEKYSHRFNYYDNSSSKSVLKDGDYSKRECAGGVGAILDKAEAVAQGYKGLGEVYKNSFGKEANKLMRTIKKFWNTSKSAFTLELYKDKLKKIYGFTEGREYSAWEGLTQVMSKTFPTIEKQVQQMKDTYGGKVDSNKNLGNKTQSKVNKIFMESTNVDQFSQYLNQTTTFQEYVFLQNAIEEVSKIQSEKQFARLVDNQKAEIADFSSLELASVLEKTKQTIKKTNKIIEEDNEGTLLGNMKKVHEKQCKDES